MLQKFFKLMIVAGLLGASFTFPSYGMEDFKDQISEETLNSQSITNILRTIEEKAKILSETNESINWPIVHQTLEMFSPKASMLIADFIMEEFFPENLKFSISIQNLSNTHLLSKAQEKLQKGIFEKIQTICGLESKQRNLSKDMIEEKEMLESFISNYENLYQAAQKRKKYIKVKNLLKDDKNLQLGTLHLENFAKQLGKLSNIPNKEEIKKRLLEFLEEPTYALIKFYQEAEKQDKLKLFFEQAFGSGCKIVKYERLTEWSLANLQSFKAEDPIIIDIKNKTQYNNENFSFDILDQKILLLVRAKLKQWNIESESNFYDLNYNELEEKSVELAQQRNWSDVEFEKLEEASQDQPYRYIYKRLESAKKSLEGDDF